MFKYEYYYDNDSFIMFINFYIFIYTANGLIMKKSSMLLVRPLVFPLYLFRKITFMMRKKIAVVTGGPGFIGSHMDDLLLINKYEVRVIDNLTGGHKKNLNHHS